MSKIKNGGLDQYGVGPSEQQQFGTAGVEGVNVHTPYLLHLIATSLHAVVRIGQAANSLMSH